MSASLQTSGRIGPHMFEVEDFVIHFHMAPDITEDDMVAFLHLAGEVYAHKGQVFTLSDARQIRSVSAGARRYATDWMQTHRFNGSAVYGMSLVARAAITLLLRAINLMRAEPTAALFCTTEREGRAWIAAQPHKP